ncbi:hypothetical protein GN244_ATG12833 [Phytophthora infestans]|uniref:Uncharacterized protein n=1 Tax=Phytophthora infestans TaxID=4787 RepID=A0A833T7K5_PHYIN|nr:hypothetical protein GN244_ATG12833 [Phytophthora infestans]KAF4134770.1 hypothetical protein GN958_ATG16026 [Phytophthora infestans]
MSASACESYVYWIGDIVPLSATDDALGTVAAKTVANSGIAEKLPHRRRRQECDGGHALHDERWA